MSIEIWREIRGERETDYLLKSETMKARLLEAKERTNGIPLEEALENLGIFPPSPSTIWQGGQRATARWLSLLSMGIIVVSQVILFQARALQGLPRADPDGVVCIERD